MVPDQLSGWDVDTLRAVLAQGVFEGDGFDFKEKLPDSRDEKGKDGLRRVCASFANASGGFPWLGSRAFHRPSRDANFSAPRLFTTSS